MVTKNKCTPGSKCGTTLTPIANPDEFDPTKPVNPNTGENYPGWYPESLYNITYDGTWENFPTTPGAINPNTGVAYTPEELKYYTAPTQFGDPFAEGYEGPGSEAWKTKNAGTGGIGGAPAYNISPEQQAWQDMLSGEIGQTIAEGGKGIPEETQAAMLQSQTDTLKAQEAENIRVMRNNMERRGITNSGFTYSNEQKIRSNTTTALAKSMTDIGIQDQMMKLASYETAIGQAAQFLGYLGDETQKKYMAQLYAWQGKLDIWKAQLSANTSMDIAQMQADLSMELAEMELEAANAQGAGKFWGSIIGFLGSLLPVIF